MCLNALLVYPLVRGVNVRLDQKENSIPLPRVQEPVSQQLCENLGFGDLQLGPRSTSDSVKWPSKRHGSSHLCSSARESIFGRLADRLAHSVRYQERDLPEVAALQ